jgi:hypothetical protein
MSFTWTPAHTQAGTYQNIHFTVSDGSLSDVEDISIVVSNVLNPDINSDGVVNILDLISIAQHWDQSGANGWIPEDVNENGSVNILDIILIGQYWTV